MLAPVLALIAAYVVLRRRVRVRITCMDGGGVRAGGGRATRALRLLLLLVLALAAMEYLFGSMIDASALRTYLYTPLYNATLPTPSNSEKLISQWPKKQSTPKDSYINNTLSNLIISKFDITNNTMHINNSTFKPNLIHNTTLKSNVTTNMTRPNLVSSTTPLMITKILESIKNLVTTEGNAKQTDPSLSLCDITPPDLGPVPVNKTDLELNWVEKKFPEVQLGGRYTPPNCTARHKVAIIVPYRDRQHHLATFLNHMHPFLMKQQIEYGIFIIEQKGTKPFNRAKLMNVGFMESQRLEPGWQCFILHDIDLLPLDTRNMYSCPKQPRHMSVAIDKFDFKVKYKKIFGGVSAVTKEQFVKVNGFSNKYWGWGGEDDDLFYRIEKMKYHIGSYGLSIARYAMLNHKQSDPNPKRFKLLHITSKTMQKDGLSTLKYELVRVDQKHLYTHIVANIDERS